MKNVLLVLIALVAIANPAATQDFGFDSAWIDLPDSERAAVMDFGEEFKEFMGRAKSHMWFVREAVRLFGRVQLPAQLIGRDMAHNRYVCPTCAGRTVFPYFV